MVRFIYSREALASKPKDARPYQQPSNYVFADKGIAEIATLLGQGHCWRAGLYPQDTKSFKKGLCQGASLLALDFDHSKHEPQEVIEYSKSIGLEPNFFYYSFSQDPLFLPQKRAKNSLLNHPTNNIFTSGVTYKRKNSPFFNFRIVYFLEGEYSPREYEETYKTFLRLFDKFAPDKSVKDCSRLWYGGKLGSTLLSLVPVPKSSIGFWQQQHKVQDGSRPWDAIKSKKGNIPDYKELPAPNAVAVGDKWWQYLQGRCPLWDKYLSGDFHYQDWLILAANLRYLKRTNRNESVLMDFYSFFDPAKYTGTSFNFEALKKKFSDNSLKPIAIVRGKLGERLTVPEFFSANPSAPVLPNVETVSTEELDRWLDSNVPQFLADLTGDMKILVSQTGSGKTKRVIDYLLESFELQSKKVIYAAPKHSNLKEVEERMQQQASFEQLGLIHRCPEKEITAADVLLLQLGLPAKTKSAKRKGFIDALFNPEEKGVFLITHSLLTGLTGLEVDQIIVDEEIDSSLVKETKLELTNLATVIPYLEVETGIELTSFINEVRERKREDSLDIDLSLLRYKVCPQLYPHIEEYIAATTNSNIAVGLFDSEQVNGKLSKGKSGSNCIRLVKISPLVADALATSTPIRVFTATPLHKETESYFNVTIPVLKAPLAANKGRVVQYTGCSGARGLNNSNLPKLANFIKSTLPPEVIDSSLLLTFKASDGDGAFWTSQGFKLATDDGTQVHLMNNSGLDCLKGKSIIVAGKMDYPNQYYQDIFDDLNGTAKELNHQNVTLELNGVTQTLYLYDDPQIRAIQLQNIQAATEQAAGRARALREEGATVYLFSNLVIKGVDEIR